jgi:hypothetical protein
MWLDLLKEAVEKTSCAEVARQLTVATGRNVSRTTISLVVARSIAHTWQCKSRSLNAAAITR